MGYTETPKKNVRHKHKLENEIQGESRKVDRAVIGKTTHEVVLFSLLEHLAGLLSSGGICVTKNEKDARISELEHRKIILSFNLLGNVPMPREEAWKS